MGRMNQLVPEQESQIVPRYLAGETMQQIGDSFGVSKSTIACRLKKAGITSRPASRLAVFKHGNVFATVNDRSAYWTGLLAADGCIAKNGAIILQLQSSDHDHVVKFMDFVGSDLPISIVSAKTRIDKNGKPFNASQHSRVQICSKEMHDSLVGYGVTPRKSKTLRISDDLALNDHFWRGYMDGNGAITKVDRKERNYIDYYVSCHSGSEQLIHQYANYLDSMGIESPQIGFNNGGWHCVAASTKAYVILKRLYGNSPQDYLNRKMTLALVSMANHEMRLKAATSLASDKLGSTPCPKSPG